MAIKRYVKNGKNYYSVKVESLNKYTGNRVQKYQSGLESRPMAKKIERKLWIKCREEKPAHLRIENWEDLTKKYFIHLDSKIRSSEKAGLSKGTVATKKSRLAHISNWNSIKLPLITKNFVREELDRLEEDGMSRAMTKEVLKEIKASFSFALDSGVIKNNPVAGLSRKSAEKEFAGLTPEEVKLLLNEAIKQDHPYYMIWLMSLFTGLRRSELAALKWTDIDFKERLISVNKQLIPGEGLVLCTKSKKTRKVPINDKIIPILKKHKIKSTSEFIIEIEGKSWLKGDQSNVLKSFCKKILITPIRHHDLRATFITQMLADNVPLGKLKEIVGHDKLSTTDRYLRKSGLDLRGATNCLSFEIPVANQEGNVVSLKKNSVSLNFPQ